MAVAVAARGHDVEIFTTDQDGTDRLDVPTNRPINVQGVQIHYFRSTLRRLWPVSIPLWRALARQIADYDLVHIHSLYLFHGAVAAYYCRRSRVPYIVRPHGTLDPYIYARHRFRKALCEVAFERRNLRNAAGIHFTAEEEQRLALPYIHGAASFVAPLGLHLDEYVNAVPSRSFRAFFPEIGDRKIVLHLGRLNFKKGLDILVDAFARVAREREDVHLVLAGPDDSGYGRNIKIRIIELGLESRATFTGLLQGELKLAAVHDASVFALPSYSENFGIAVVEAMACGCPVVISDKVNIWREVKAGGAGLIIECSADACASALSRLLGDETLRKEMGHRGQRLVRERFNWSSLGAQLEGAYEDIISRYRTNRAGSHPAIAAK